jgi:hypothetical protein
MSKKVLVLFLVLSLSVGFSYGVVNESFSDVSEEDWFSDSVHQMKSLGIINGYEDGTFKPYGEVKRNEYAKLLVKTLKLPTKDNSSSIFKDVPSNDWALKYVMAARTYLTGYQSNGDYYFKPNEKTLREDIIVALVKGLGYELKDEDLQVLETYEDADQISENLKPYLATALVNDVVQGYTEGDEKYIRPLTPITRAETAHLLLKVIDMEKITFDDEEKIVLDGDDLSKETDNESMDYSGKNLNVQVEKTNNGVLIKWTGVEGVQGYKVVASEKEDSHLKYPEDGYYQYTQDTMTAISLYEKYQNGDFYEFTPGKTYSFNINLYLKDGSAVPTEGFTVTFPEKSESYQESILLEGVEKDGSVVLEWEKYLGSDFKGYKVVASREKALPEYPEDGYYKYLTNREDNRVEINKGNAYNGTFKTFGEETYTFRITVLTHSGKVFSNPITLTLD